MRYLYFLIIVFTLGGCTTAQMRWDTRKSIFAADGYTIRINGYSNLSFHLKNGAYAITAMKPKDMLKNIKVAKQYIKKLKGTDAEVRKRITSYLVGDVDVTFRGHSVGGNITYCFSDARYPNLKPTHCIIILGTQFDELSRNLNTAASVVDKINKDSDVAGSL